MKKSINITGAVILLLSIAIVTMAFGFAAFSQNLKIENSTVNIAASKWDVHFDNTSYNETTNSVVATNHTLTSTSFNFDINLQEPGDFYETTIKVENKGTFDALLQSISMSTAGLTDGQAFLEYSIIYDGVKYTQSTTDPINKKLEVDDSEEVVIRVEYLTPANASQLPDTNVTATVSGTLLYVQDES